MPYTDSECNGYIHNRIGFLGFPELFCKSGT